MTRHTAATCTAESDGYHEHTFQSGITKVTEHLHAWIDDHLAYWPGTSRVYIGDQPYPGTAAQAWAEITGNELPPIDCKEVSR